MTSGSSLVPLCTSHASSAELLHHKCSTAHIPSPRADFGNFQDPEGKQREKAERLRFGRFFYRFPDGESGADVYDRLTIFEDHLIRDINAGRFANKTSLVLVTHGLALRIFLMRWFHWTVDQFLNVYNPPNAEVRVVVGLARVGWGGWFCACVCASAKCHTYTQHGV